MNEMGNQHVNRLSVDNRGNFRFRSAPSCATEYPEWMETRLLFLLIFLPLFQVQWLTESIDFQFSSAYYFLNQNCYDSNTDITFPVPSACLLTELPTPNMHLLNHSLTHLPTHSLPTAFPHSLTYSLIRSVNW